MDFLIEASGNPGIISKCFEMVRRLGTVCAIGITGTPEVSIPYDRGIFKGIRFDFCFSSSWTSWEKTISLLSNGRLKLDTIITHRLPLEEWEKAFNLLETRQAVKVILIP